VNTRKDEEHANPRVRAELDGNGWLAPMAGGDFELEARLGRVLRFGVRASSLCLGGGLLVSLASSDATLGNWLMTIGLVLLMATPVARVAVSVVDYAVHRDWPFFILTGIVLLELAAGVVAALVFHRRL